MNRRDDNRGQNRPGEGAAGRDMGRNKFTTKMQRKLVVLFIMSSKVIMNLLLLVSLKIGTLETNLRILKYQL